VSLLANFGEHYPRDCGNCDNCLEPQQTWDGTEAARKALSAVFRTGQRFGVQHLTAVLRGEAGERVSQFGHDRLGVFGVGADLDAKQWRGVFRQLVALGLVESDPDGHGGLRLAEASRPVLRGEQPVLLRREAAPVSRKERKSRGGTTTASVAPVNVADAPLFEALRALRASLAREQGVPPYVIFHDATLRAIAERRPRDLDALGEVGGVGASKQQRYGEQVLAVVQQLADAEA
jgi:ATP-dependent DNA helicase RecQ